jgi:hypothetical protein
MEITEMKCAQTNHGIVRLLAGMALMSVATPSLARHAHTRDPKCSFEVPMGAMVDSDGNVSKDGASVDRFDFTGCKSSDGGGPGGWYEQVGANSIPQAGGMNQFNYLYSSFYVPPEPYDSSTQSVYLFPGLENWSPSGQVYSILQGMLLWGYNTDQNTGDWYVIEGEFNWGPNIHGQAIRVSPGDLIKTSIWQVQTNPDLWEIEISDTTNGGYYYFYAQPDASWTKYTNAYSAVVEAYGESTQQTGLASCEELPFSYGMTFNTEVWQAGPAWNSYNDVTGSLSWGGSTNGNGLAPSCAWKAYGSGMGTLAWTP